jgi:hypothetical protein
MKASNLVLGLGVASVVIPAIACIVGFVLMYSIPGCNCDAGAGCRGCGNFNTWVANLSMGGFVGTLGAILFVLPPLAIIFAVLSYFKK